MKSSTTSAISDSLLRALQNGINKRVFSGAQVSFSIENKPATTIVAGETSYTNGRPIAAQTQFDIASLTKLFTATVALRMVDQGIIDLKSIIWSSFSLEALLAHESGLPAWKPFFESVPTTERGTRQGYDHIIDQVLQEHSTNPIPHNALYSDIGYIGLAHYLAQMKKLPLHQLVQNEVMSNLGMPHTSYRPVPAPSNANIACTEKCPWRAKVLQGEVHDDNAWTMGGVAGHAGIFSTSIDIVKLGNAWLNARATGGLVSKKLAQTATLRRPSGRGLGFDLKSPGGSSMGNTASNQTFGHLGFTGTSVWIDPQKNAVICLLSNRVHPSRDNIKIRNFRPYFHELFFSNL